MDKQRTEELETVLDAASLHSVRRLQTAFVQKTEPDPLDVLVVRAMIATKAEDYGANPWGGIRKHGLHWASGAGVGSIIVALIQQVGTILAK